MMGQTKITAPCRRAIAESPLASAQLGNRGGQSQAKGSFVQ
jgi:hypothetical protein